MKGPVFSTLLIGLVCGVWLAATSVAVAGNLYWDGGVSDIGSDGNGVSAGTSGTWDTSLKNWDVGAVPHTNWINANHDTAIFAGTAGTVSLGTGITVGGLQFDTANYIITNSTLTFGTVGSIVANQNVTISSVIAGTVPITKLGSGTLILTGTNTCSGTMTNSAGTLQVGNGSGTGSLGSFASVVNNASLVYDITNSTANNVLPWMAMCAITGSGSLIVNGGASGSLLVGGDITQGGSMTFMTQSGLIWDGLRIEDSTRTFTASAISITGLVGSRNNGNSTLKLDTSSANGTITLDLQSGASGRMYPVSLNANAGTGTIIMSGTRANGGGGSWSGNNGNILVGGLNISSSFAVKTLNATATATSTISGSLTLSANTHTFTVNPGVAMTISGSLSGTGAAITKLGTGTLVLAGTNTYNGLTTISTGKVVGVTGGSCSNSAVTVASGATIGARVLTSGGLWICSNLTFSSGTTTAEFDFVVAPNTLVAPLLINGNLTNNGTLNVSVVSGTFVAGLTYPLIRYTGSLTVGTLGTVTLPGGAVGTLVNNSGNKTIDLSVTTGNGGLTWSAGTGAWDINTSSNWNSGTNTYTDGSLVLFDDTASGGGPFTVTLNTNVNPGAVYVNNTSKAYTLGGSGAMTGATALVKSGTGTLILTNANTYSGTTTIGGGTLQVGNGGATGSLGSGAVVDNGTLVYNIAGGVGIPASLTGSGNLTVTNAVNIYLTNSLTLGGSIRFTTAMGGQYGIRLHPTGNGGVTRTLTGSAISLTGLLGDPFGANTLVLDTSAANGPIDLNLQNGQSSSLYSHAINANAGTGAFTLSGNNAGNIAWNNASGYSFRGALNISSSFTVSTLSLTSTAASVVSGNLTLSSAANTFTCDPGVTNTISGNLSGASAAITKLGMGTLVLSGTNTYSGATTVNAGKLVGVTGGSCSNSAVTVASGATIGARVLTSGGRWTCSNLTFSSSTTTAEFDFAVLPSTTVAPLLINGNLTNNGTLNVSVVSGELVTGTTYPLIQYTDNLAVGTLGTITLPGGALGTLVNNTGNKTIDLSVSTGNELVWSAGTGYWDINTSSNWNGGTTKYTEGRGVRFDDSPGGGPFTVTLNTNVNPSSVTVTNSVKAYTIGGSGAITGATALVKSGSGTLTITNNNTYTGTTTISGGMLQVGNGGAAGSLGSGAVVDNGTLAYNIAGAVGIPSSLTGSGNLTVTNAVNIYLTNSVTLGGSIRFTTAMGGGNGIRLHPTGNGGVTRTLTGSAISLTGLLGDPLGANTLVLDTSAANGSIDLNLQNGQSGSLYAHAINANAGTGALTISGNNAGNIAWNNATGYSFRGALIISSSFTVSTLSLTSTAASVVSGNLTLSSAANTFTCDPGVTNTISGNLSGASAAITKLGMGTLVLSGTNTYSGATTVNAGKLVGVTGGSCSNSAVTVASGATIGARVLTSGGRWTCSNLTFSSSTTTAEFDFVAAPNTLVAPLLINGNLTNNGTLNVSVVSGELVTGATYPLIQYTGSLTVGTLGTVALPNGAAGTLVNNTGNKTIDLSVSTGNELVWSAGTGAWDINTSANWNSGATKYTEGRGVRFDDSPVGGGPFAVTLNTNVNPSSVTVTNSAKAYTIGGSGAITGATTLVKSGTGTVTLTGANPYSGGTTISGGTVNYGHTNALGTGTLTFSGSSTLQAGLSGAITNNVSINSGVTATFDSQSFSPTNRGIVSGSGALTKIGVGTLMLSGANTYEGTTAVSNGVLLVNGSISTGAVTVASGGTLGGTGTVGGVVTVNGAVAPGSGGIGTLTTSNVTWNASVAWPFQLGAASSGDRLNINGDFTKGSGSGFTFDFQNTGAAGVYTVATWSASTTFAASDFVAINVLSGLAKSFAISGTNLLLTVQNIVSFTWDTDTGNSAITEGGGTWQVGVGNWYDGLSYDQSWLDGKSAIFGGGSGGTAGTVTLGGNVSASGITFNAPSAGNYTINLATYTLTLSGNITANSSATITNGTISLSGTQAFMPNVGSLSVYSKITGSGGLSKAQGSSLYLYNDANDFTGNLFMQNGGSVYVTSINNSNVASAAGAGSIIEINHNASLVYNGTGNSSTDRQLKLGDQGNANNTLLNNGGGTLVFAGSFTNSKTVSGTFWLGGINAGANEIRGNITDNGGLTLGVTKQDAGTWILSGTNTYTGAMTITGGKLIIGGAGTLGSGSYSNTIAISSGATFEYGSSSSQTLSGVISGAGGMVGKSGTGTLTLTGTNTYTGATTISGGTLTIGGAGMLGNGNYAAALTNNATLIYASSASQTNSGVISGSGSLTSSGSGTLTLSGTNTYTGLTAVNAGILALGVNGSITNSAGLVLGAGTTFDVSAKTTFTLGIPLTATTNATLRAGTTVNLGSQPITLNYDGTNPALVVSEGTLFLSNNAFVVNGSLLTSGTHVLVRQTSGTITSGTATYPVSGTAISAGCGATVTVVGNQVILSIPSGSVYKIR